MQIPVVTDVASLAKCPHCNNEIRVRDLLASAVPEAEIIVEEKDTNRVSDYIADRQRVYDDDSPKSREKFEVPSQLYNGASRRNRKRRNGSRGSSSRSSSSRDSSSRQRTGNNGSLENSQSRRPNSGADVSSNGHSSNPNRNSNSGPKSPSVDSSEGSTTANKPTPVSRPASTSRPAAARNTSQERRAPAPVPRPRKSPSRERRSDHLDDEGEFGVTDILKFLVGGVIAAPLAYLALLWVLGVDPFGMASTFESVSPSIIPDSLRSEGYGDEPRSGFAPPAGDSSSALFGSSAGDDGLGGDFEDDDMPLPSLDPDMVR